MNEILKYLGILVILVGVALLAVYEFTNYPGNGMLIAAGACVVIGAIVHVVLNRCIE